MKKTTNIVNKRDEIVATLDELLPGLQPGQRIYINLGGPERIIKSFYVVDLPTVDIFITEIRVTVMVRPF